MISIKDLKYGDKIKITENGAKITSIFQMYNKKLKLRNQLFILPINKKKTKN